MRVGSWEGFGDAVAVSAEFVAAVVMGGARVRTLSASASTAGRWLMMMRVRW